MKKSHLFISISLMMLISIWIINKVSKNIEYSEEKYISNQTVGEIKKGIILRQNIFSEKKKLASIRLFFGTYKRVNNDVLIFRLYDSRNNKKLREVKIKTAKLQDNQQYNIIFKSIKNSENKFYYFTLTSLNGKENNSVTVYKDNYGVLYDLGYYKTGNFLSVFSIIFIVIAYINAFLFLCINKKFRPLPFIFSIFIIIETCFVLNRINNHIYYERKINNKEIETTIGGLQNNRNKEQIIFSRKNNLSGIEVKFGTYNRINTDKILFKLYSKESNEELRRVLIDTSLLQDNQDYRIQFNSLKNSKNKMYYFKLISLAGNDENSVTLYSDARGSILYNLGYRIINENILFYSVTLITTIIGIFLLFYFIKNRKKETIFLILGLIYGVIFIFIFPPMQIPDEEYHFYKAFAIAQGKILPQKLGIKGQNGNELPTSVKMFSKMVRIEEIKFNYNEKLNLSDLENMRNIPLNPDNLSKINLAGAAIINPLSYIPQAIGIGIGNILRLPIFLIFYLGRIFNFISWISIIYISIKKAPEKIKSFILILSLLPISIQQGVSMSPDALINAFSMLFISFLFKLYLEEKEKFNFSYGLVFFLGIFIPTTIKVVYFLFILLICGLPINKFKNKKNYFIIIIAIVIITLGVNIGWGIISPENPVSPIGQINDLKSNLWNHVGRIYLTTREMLQFYIESLVGVLGSLDTRVPYLLIYSYIILLGLYASVQNILKKDFKMLIFIILYLVGTYTGILTALYIAWTRPSEIYISGVQGRYLLPLVPIFLIFLSKKRIDLNIAKIEIDTGLFLNFGLVYTIFVIISRYYV